MFIFLFFKQFRQRFASFYDKSDAFLLLNEVKYYMLAKGKVKVALPPVPPPEAHFPRAEVLSVCSKCIQVVWGGFF